MSILIPSLVFYIAAHIVVTIIGMLHTAFNVYVLKMKPMDEHSLGEGYEKTKPWHPLYNIVIFPAAAWLFFQQLDTAPSEIQLLQLSLLWLVITVVIDYAAWVLIRHPWHVGARKFYIDYQPWISLVYVAIFIAPFVAFWVM